MQKVQRLEMKIMEMSSNINELSKALTAVQANLEPAKFNAANPFFKSKYADLNSIFNACRHLLVDYGLSISQFPGSPAAEYGPAIALTTILMHESGQWIRDTMIVPIAKPTPQDAGSALTYARRYALSAIIGIVADEDDDVNRAQHKTKASDPNKTKYNINDEVLVAGKNDEKVGSVVGFSDGGLIMVQVDGENYSVSPDRLKVLK